MCTQNISISEGLDYLNYLNNCTEDKIYPPLRLYEDDNFLWIEGLDSKAASISKVDLEVIVDGFTYTDLEDTKRALLVNINKVNSNSSETCDLTPVLEKLDEIYNILADQEVPFERNTGVDELIYQLKGSEYLVFLLKTNPIHDLAFIEKYDVSCLSNANDNYLIKIGFGKVFSHTFVDSNFVDIGGGSKLQIAIPGENGVPANVIASGFSAGGRDINSKFGKGREGILFEGKNPITMPKDIFIMAVTITPMSNGAAVATSLNWSEKDEQQ